MTKLAYLQCPTGLAGDMCLGALVHAGVPLKYLSDQLKKLGIASEYRLWAESVSRNGQQATKVHVDLVAQVPATVSSSAEGAGGDRPLVSPSQAGSAPAHEPAHPHSHPHTHSETAHPTVHSPEHPQTQHEHSSPAAASHHPSGVRHLPEIERLIQAAHLPPQAAAWSLAVFRQLAVAEGAVHGISPEQVHFHEVGATDAIVDIVGTCLGLDWLGIEQLYCSALPVGGGTVWAAHGRLPVPAPAVLKLWEMRQIPVYSNGIECELVTPTGAAIATTLATQFGSPPPMTLQQVGLGAGSRDLPIPNVLRLWIGESPHPGSQLMHHTAQPALAGAVMAMNSFDSTPRTAAKKTQPDRVQDWAQDLTQEPILVLETQIDDLNPQAIGYVFERLFAAGAVDVFTQAIGMKKSRPGILLSVVCHPEQATACETVIFQETTTLGIRRLSQQRTILHREMHTVETEYGAVRVKVARWGKQGAIANVQPEYEDCAQIAERSHQPWRQIHQAALQAWYRQSPGGS